MDREFQIPFKDAHLKGPRVTKTTIFFGVDLGSAMYLKRSINGKSYFATSFLLSILESHRIWTEVCY